MFSSAIYGLGLATCVCGLLADATAAQETCVLPEMAKGERQDPEGTPTRVVVSSWCWTCWGLTTRTNRSTPISV